jgi:hypothetical protein
MRTRPLSGIVRCLVVSALALALLPGAAGAATPTPADRAATRSYLVADYEYAGALVANAHASIAAVDTFTQGLTAECRGVLSGAPSDESHEDPASRSARQQGEDERSEQQFSTIDSQVGDELFANIYSPDRTAMATFDARVSQLRWSDPRIATLVRSEAGLEAAGEAGAGPQLCADMRFWAASGYRTLSPASRAFEAEQEARLHNVAAGTVQTLLAPYLSSSDRALLRRTKSRLTHFGELLDSSTAVRDGDQSILHNLGLPESRFEEDERGPVLGSGRTASGEKFVVRLDRPPSGERCRVAVTVDITKPNGSGGGSGGCISARPGRAIQSSCNESVTSVTLAVTAAVTKVRLLLGSGRTITSRVLRVPRRDGGPLGIYVQAVRGYENFPVSFTELDRNGRTVRVVRFPARQRCRREPKADRAGPTFVTLVHGTAPGGEPFAIQGTLVHFGRGQTNFSVALEQPPGVVSDEESQHTFAVEPSSVTLPPAFETSLRTECTAHRYTAVFGILSPPGAAVLARTAEGLVPLTKLVLSAKLHAPGPLFYGVFATAPTELVIQRSDGTTLYSESLVGKAREGVEFCEGYDEPSAASG